MKDLYERFPALQSREFRIFWLGQIVSVLGNQMQTAALRWQMYELTGSALALGAMGLARVLPIAVFALVGGMFADAHDRRRLLIVTQCVMFVVALAYGVLTKAGWMTAYAIYALSAVSAACLAFNNPARQAFVANLVPAEHFANAASLNTLMRQVATIAGPPIAGLLIATGGTAIVYWINAASFVGVLGALLAIRATSQQAPSGRIDMAALREGLAFMRKSPILMSTTALDFLATFFSSAETLLPIFAKEILHVGAKGYGVLAAAPAVGSLVAGAVISWLPRIEKQGRVLLWAVVAYGLATLVFGLSQWYALSLVALAVGGAADTVSTVIRQTIRQLATPDHLRGRIVSVTMVFFMGGPQLGELEAGLVAALIGAPLSVAIGGIGCLISVAVIAHRVPKLREYEGT